MDRARNESDRRILLKSQKESGKDGIVPAYEPEDLLGAVEEAMRREKVKRKKVKGGKK